MAQYDTGKDILESIMRRAGEIMPTDVITTGSDHLIDAKLYIQGAYWDLVALKPWRWARKRVQFVSVGQVIGLATGVSGVTATLSSNIATSMAERKFYLDGDGIPFRITAHTGGTNILTLSAAYTGATVSGTFTIFQDELSVASDILAFPIVKELHWGSDLMIIPEGESEKYHPRNVFGMEHPQYVSFLTDSTIRIVPWTRDPRLFECSYNYRPDPLDFSGNAGTDTPIIPRDCRIAIMQRALSKIYSDKRDARMQLSQQELDETLAKMSAMDSTFGRPRIRMSPGLSVSGR